MDYTGSGNINICGTASFNVKEFYPYLFAIGSVVYPRIYAIKGRLERIGIKNVHRNSFGEFTYVDTFNRAWLEDELLWFDDAKDIALAFLESQGQSLAALNC